MPAIDLSRVRHRGNRLVAAVRVSVGLATNVPDVHRLLCFLQGFVDRSVEEIGEPQFVSDNCRVVRDSA